VPLETALAQVERMTDGYRRDAKGLDELFKVLVPGWAKDVRTKQDVLGHDIPQQTGFAALLPRTTTEVNNPVLAEDDYLRSKNPNFIGLTKVGTTIGSGTAQLKLDPDQHHDFQQIAGQYQEQDLAALIGSNRYQQASVADRTKLWNTTMSDSRQRASSDFLVNQVGGTRGFDEQARVASMAAHAGTNLEGAAALTKMQRSGSLTPELQTRIDASRTQPDPKKPDYQLAVDEYLRVGQLADSWVKAPSFNYGTAADWAAAERARDQYMTLQKEFPPTTSTVKGKPVTTPSKPVEDFYAAAAGGLFSFFYTKGAARKSKYISEDRRVIEKDPLWSRVGKIPGWVTEVETAP